MYITILIASVDEVGDWSAIIDDETFVDTGTTSVEFVVIANDIENCFEAVTNVDRQWLHCTASTRSDEPM